MTGKIYLDSCCFNRPFDDQIQPKVRFETQAKLFIQGLVLNKEIKLVWSYVLKFENSRNIFEAKRNAIARWENLSAQFVNASAGIIADAEEIARTGVAALDALHIACAIAAGCDYCVTVDKRMLKYQDKRIVICSPIEFLNRYFEML